jgi:dihydrodipicolinate synthase/N-acetylneuraminate lyase
MLTPQDIRGLYAIMPTPSRHNASRLSAESTVDLEETERVVNALIADGVHGLIALGTTGECATLSQPDYDSFVSCFLEVVNRRVPVFVGTSALGGHEVVRRMRFIRERGADGTLLGLPMWQPMSMSMAVDFYAGISEMFPDVAIMVYANERAFRFSFSDEFWAEVIQRAPTVVAAKYSRPKDLTRLLSILKGRVNIVPNEMTMAKFYEESPETTTACWATAASMGPWPALELMRAVTERNEKEVRRLSEVLAWANETVRPIIADKELFGTYTVQVEKTRIDAAGYCKAGPIRPPYNNLPDELRMASEECGRRWAMLCVNRANGIVIPDTVAA